LHDIAVSVYYVKVLLMLYTLLLLIAIGES